MTRIETILKMARYTLADPGKQRWDDETLVDILNEALIDFCQQTQMLHERVEVPIVLGNPYFTLPSDCWMLTRVLYDNDLLPLVTHHELDIMGTSLRNTDFNITVGAGWEEATGIPEAIIYDRRDMLQGKIYPIPNDPLEEVDYLFIGSTTITFQPMPDTELYGVTTATEDLDAVLADNYGVISALASFSDIELNDSYGVASGVALADDVVVSNPGFGVIIDMTDYEFNSDFGTVVNMSDPNIVDEVFEETYGFVDGVTESSSSLIMYYLKNPLELTDVNSIIETPQMYDIALKFYLCGQALMNDVDAASSKKGALQMVQYDARTKSAKKDSAKAFTRAGQFHTTYRSAF